MMREQKWWWGSENDNEKYKRDKMDNEGVKVVMREQNDDEKT